MTLTIEVPESLEADLRAGAQRSGLPVDEYAVRLLATGLLPEPSVPMSGADLLEYWRREGVIGSLPDIIDPAAHARALRARAEARGVE